MANKYKSSNITPATSDWLSKSSNKIDNKDSDPVGDLMSVVDAVPLHELAECGLTHPINTSSIKIKDNGMIDVFVSTNQGFRIDPKTKSINIIANNITNRTNDYRAFVENHSITNCRKNFEVYTGSNIKMYSNKESNYISIGNMTVTTESNYNLNVTDSMYTTVEGNKNDDIIKEWTINVGGNVNLTTKGKCNINASDDINLTTNGNFNVQANGEMNFNARYYNWR